MMSQSLYGQHIIRIEKIIITDLSGDIEYVNPAFSEITGYNSDEAIGKNICFLKSGEHKIILIMNCWT